ncbi:MAG: B12-binding domain-containing protein [Isosphaeraceae bacterium]
MIALKRGDGVAVRSLIQGAHQSGVAMETLADFVIAPAMKTLGHEWEAGRIKVFHGHRGTPFCVSALYELKAVLEARVDRDRPLAAGGSSELD